MPYITEEIYQNYFRKFEKEISIHLTTLSKIDVENEQNIIQNGDMVVDIVSKVRAFKGENKLSMKTEIDQMTITAQNLDFLKDCESDIKAVCSVRNINFAKGSFSIEIGKPILE